MAVKDKTIKDLTLLEDVSQEDFLIVWDNSAENNNTKKLPVSELMKNQGDSYSTEETVIGTWIDGKPIYRKVFNLNIPHTSTQSSSYQLPVNIPYLKNIITHYGFYRADFYLTPNTLSPRTIPQSNMFIYAYDSQNTNVPAENRNFYFSLQTTSDYIISVIVEYTKTSDD